MPADRSIAELIKADGPLLSVEFFPPKNEKGGEQILRAAGSLRNEVKPDFVSITYGAGGSTREMTHRYARLLRDDFGFRVMPHLTCVGSSVDELRELLAEYKREGFRNIMALRGDPPKGAEKFEAHEGGFRYASDLVCLIKEEFPEFCLGVAGYPERHPESPNSVDDLRHLKGKVDCGASFITTQLFFDNSLYFRFTEACRELGLSVPIIPGILPVLSLNQIQKFCAMCGAMLPAELVERLKSANGDPKAVEEIGVQWAYDQVRELLEKGAPGVHLYILNRSRSALALANRLRADGLLR